MSPVAEGLYASLMEDRRNAWERRAKSEGLTDPQRKYAAARARTLSKPYAAKLAKCSLQGVNVKCGCPGKRDVRWYTCRQHLLCETCRAKRGKKLRPRIRAGLETAWKAEIQQNHRLQVVLVTLTVRHSGDVGADRATVARAWRAFYKAYVRRFGKFTYVGVHEATAGRDGMGHAHMHIACIWPRGAPGSGTAGDWKLLARLWRQSAPTSTRINFEPSHGAKHAAWYVSKYVAKGIEAGDWTPELRTRLVCGTYNTRWLMTSRRFWQPFEPLCPCCGQRVVRAAVEVPWSTSRVRKPFVRSPDTPPSEPELYVQQTCISDMDFKETWHGQA